MDLHIEGVMHNGVIVPDDASAIPEGTRVRIEAVAVEKPRTLGEELARFKGVVRGLPNDLADQHDHYRLGTTRR